MTKLTRGKPKLAVWKFTSCDGCQLTLLNHEDELLKLLGDADLAYFPEATSSHLKGPYQLSLVEGSISTAHEAEKIQEVRAASKYLVTMGACAMAGGLQALRNFKDAGEFTSVVYPMPDYVETLHKSTPISEHVTVDYEARGCPVNTDTLIQVVRAFLFGEPLPETNNRSVCVDCKKLGLSCIMLDQGITCMGPLTQSGCGALCPSFNRACAGCYGPRKFAHPEALERHWRQLGIPEGEIARAFRGIHSYSETYRNHTLKEEAKVGESN
ncbi:MAG: oxidoreductase [Chloroflexi bacterium]|uniref:Oxidoreductase n=1 Tax=Candidatus Chlorohelix allophototropha TaxID=3003348 RepID=A0A8T7M133_9CHLR|nr:oxidoreductase [Chloroflexota bacterium]WJW66200.1 hypothetical protein OZ401_001991 [Chloroflexota bacterium L227-S17]